MHKYLCLFERININPDWGGVDFAFVYAKDEETAAKRFINYLLDEGIESYIDESYWVYVIVSTDTPIVGTPKDNHQSQLEHDIDHIDEIKNVMYRVSLKNKLGIPRNEKDQKDLDSYIDGLKKLKNILNITSCIDAETKNAEIQK